jgi:hypothetical protein
MFGSWRQTYLTVGFVAAAVAASAIWQNLSGPIMSASIGVVSILVGIRGTLRPEQVKATMAAHQPTARAKKTVERSGVMYFRLMWIGFVVAGVYLLWIAAWLIWPDYVSTPIRIPSYHIRL